ncbi:RNA polymerase sigma factor [Sporosarcina sp. SAFN-015]|uniref:RNA polymerase sigma factor n=1 Tax=Sporosarcina sp. SAFN-015 TaxID=3387274 RepID=UPI003F81587D
MDVKEKRMLKGDQVTFKGWMEKHVRTIERFAVQFGASLEEAGTVTEKAYRNVYKDHRDVTDLKESTLYINVLQELDGRQTAETSGGFFSFEEDNELHCKLIGMPAEYRVPFILDRFHTKSLIEIAEITGMTEQQVRLALTKAYSIMDEPNLDKKLEFLNKSYERLSSSYNETKIFHSKVDESPIVEQKSETAKKKRPYLFWSVGTSLLLVLLSIITYTNSDAYQLKSSEKFIEAAKVTFQEELERNLKLAGLPAPQLLRNDIYAETYGEDTRREFDWLIANLNEQLEQDGKFDQVKAKSDFDALIRKLKVPSEMVAGLSKNPLVNDEKKSMEFMNEYYKTSNILLNSYMNILYGNEKLIYDAGLVGRDGFDYESFIENKSTFPKNLQEAIIGMEEQGFYLKGDPEGFLYPKYGNPELTGNLRENLHSNMDIYISLMTDTLFNFHLRPIEEQVDLLLQTEKAVLRAEEYPVLYSNTYNLYIWMMYSVTGMVEQAEIRDSTGVIKEEYKEAWTRIAFNGKDSPAAQLLREVVIDMEESGWTTSRNLEKLQYFYLEGKLRELIGEMKR